MEYKVNNDSGSSGERNWKSPNLLGFHLLIQVDKLVDEYLKGVVTLQTTFCESTELVQSSHKAARATIILHKVKN